jgi:hypothetical protein
MAYFRDFTGTPTFVNNGITVKERVESKDAQTLQRNRSMKGKPP